MCLVLSPLPLCPSAPLPLCPSAFQTCEKCGNTALLGKDVFRGKHKHYSHQQIEEQLPLQHEAYFLRQKTTYKGDRRLYKHVKLLRYSM
ncbi:MAG: hypothetical protein V7L23_24740 [Nostoc sp.]|uniref:hypothetical protein n=1 Tax=Nostoc sp. TaxID=1180 RepID=UPI002FEF7FEA